MRKNGIVVTGANRGIGYAVAEYFLKQNEMVIPTARKGDSVQNIAGKFGGFGENVLSAQLDVTDKDMVNSFVSEVEKTINIDCIVNNAGITSFKSAEEDSIEEIEKIMQTNFLGAVYLIKNVLPFMKERKQGTIINIVTVAAKTLFTNSSIYAASKAALLRYSDVLREEVRPYGIKVVNVLPGATKTEIWSEDMTNQFGDKMMNPVDVAEVIYGAYSSKNNLVQEEIILRPVTGNL